MELRIVVPDATSATALADRLTVAFGSEHVSLRGERREVDVLIDREPDPAILRVLDAVERWLDQARVGVRGDVARRALVQVRQLGSGRDVALIAEGRDRRSSGTRCRRRGSVVGIGGGTGN